MDECLFLYFFLSSIPAKILSGVFSFLDVPQVLFVYCASDHCFVSDTTPLIAAL